MSFGASPDEWLHFDLILGLTEDLLPVVSDPNAKKSPHSSIKDPGKLPSLFNRYGQMVGFTGWTNHRATPEEIDEWKTDDRFGICVQTRRMRAIDVDITDFDEAFEAEHIILEFFGRKVPTRRRPGSNKFLIPFFVDGEFKKKKFPTKSGEKNAIEFLANGQQFIAIGTHKEGMRYEWDGGLPSDVPTLDIAEFEALWSKLHEKLGAAESTTARSGVAPSKARREEDINDPVYDYLVDHWETFDTSRDGRLDIACPFKAGHSTDSGPTSTSYYPAGVGGFERGHFKCLHASCTHRVDNDFLNEIGFNTQGFEELPLPPAEIEYENNPAAQDVDGLLPAQYHLLVKQAAKTLTVLAANRYESGPHAGLIVPKREMVQLALSSPVLCHRFIAFDAFREELMIAKRRGEWEPFQDTDYQELVIILESDSMGCHFHNISIDVISRSVAIVAKNNRFDSAQKWLSAQKWDGVKRVDNFLHQYMRAEDSDYTRAISRYWWTASAARVMFPGVKADMIPLAVGAQGARKTSAVEAMAPHPDFFGELDLAKNDDALCRDIRGKLVSEIGEMKGANIRDINHMKSFVTKRFDKWVPKYKEYQTSYPRRCMFFGTANGDEPLPPDDTGQRRWLPFNLIPGERTDSAGIAAVCSQLWAEGLEMFKANGNRIMWEDAERLAAKYTKNYTPEDPWQHRIEDWLNNEDDLETGRPADRALTLLEIASGALSIPARDTNALVQKRIGSCLRKLGFDKTVKAKRKVWIKT